MRHRRVRHIANAADVEGQWSLSGEELFGQDTQTHTGTRNEYRTSGSNNLSAGKQLHVLLASVDCVAASIEKPGE